MPDASATLAAPSPVARLRGVMHSPATWPAACVLLLLLAAAVRLFGIDGLQIFGDSASSVFFASRSWPQIAAETARDSHPPLYYYLLRLALDTFGWNEMGARLPSLIPGILTVAVVLGAGRKLAGARGGIAAGLLAALSPPLIIYSRQPRMYALVTLLGLLLVVLAAWPRFRWRGLVLGVLAFAALMTHYFAALAVAAAALVAVVSAAWPPGRPRGSPNIVAGARSLIPFATAAALWLPWLVYALPASLEHTAKTISGVPPPPTLLHFLGGLAIFVPVGSFVALVPSMALAVAAWAAAGVALLAGRRVAGWPAAAAGIVLLGAMVLYLAAPEFARPRFFLLLVPLGFLALAPAFARANRLAASGLLGLMVLVLLGGSAASFITERGTFELDSVRLAAAMRPGVRDGDTVILQAWWQAGYLATHLRPTLHTIALDDLSNAGRMALVEQPGQVWLVLAGAGRSDPGFPVEPFLDSHAYRVSEQTFGGTRLVRYLVRQDPAPEMGADFGSVIHIDATPLVREVAPGGAIPVYVNWKSLRPPGERLVLFLHLVGLDGRGRAGRDGEPADGASPTDHWAANIAFEDRRGLVVPEGVPPGEYNLLAGIYRRNGNQRLATPNGDTLDLGRITVIAPPAQAPAIATFDSRLDLLDWSLDRQNPMAARQQRLETIDGVQTLTFPVDAQPGGTLGIVFNWRARQTLPDATLFVHLLDPNGSIAAQSDGPPGGISGQTLPLEGLVTTRSELALPAQLPDATYTLEIGFYLPDGTRLPVTGVGIRTAASFALGQVVVARPE